MVAQPSSSSTAPSSTAEPAQAKALLTEQILAKLQHLSPEHQQQVLDFVDFLAQKNPPQPPQQTIWEKIDERMAEVPDEEWEKLPTDGSYQHDHYLYGTPKREL
jgi:hypothetical protein